MAFSIYGYLDAMADTQWIRVAPFRSSIFSTSDPVDAVVTIEDLGTGRRIEMIPTLFTRVSANFGDTLYAYNFKTVEPIEHGATYRLTAQRSDGAASSAVVEIPPDLTHLPVLIAGTTVSFPMEEGDHVGMVNTFHYIPDFVFVTPPGMLVPCNVPVWIEDSPQRNFAPSTPGYYLGRFIRLVGLDRPEPCNGPFERVELMIARSREPWPFSPFNNYTNIGGYTNIENGVGFLAGLSVARISLEGCTYTDLAPGTTFPTSCAVYVGRETATLRVTVIHSLPPGMGDIPFAPRVILQPADVTWGRVGTQFPSWDLIPPVFVRFVGYLPGSYRIRVENPFGGALSNLAVYCEERSIDLALGEQNVDITMVRVLDFPNEPVNANGCREG
jgi:hypothetical protein